MKILYVLQFIFFNSVQSFRTYRTVRLKIPLLFDNAIANIHIPELSISEDTPLELINNIPEVSMEEILRKDLVQLKYRVDRVEKAIATGNLNKPLGTVSNFIESITANTMELNGTISNKITNN